MKLSTRTRYGIRALLELAEHFGRGPLQLKVIAARQDISMKYLEQLMTVLKSAGIVRSVRGPNGGYMLARNPQEVKVIECFNCLEGDTITPECVGDSTLCPRSKDCITRQLWTDLQRTVAGFLRSITMQNLIDRRTSGEVLDYHI